jgi:hypothetical protein
MDLQYCIYELFHAGYRMEAQEGKIASRACWRARDLIPFDVPLRRHTLQQCHVMESPEKELDSSPEALDRTVKVDPKVFAFGSRLTQ